MNYTGQTKTKHELKNLTVGLHRDDIATVNFS